MRTVFTLLFLVSCLECACTLSPKGQPEPQGQVVRAQWDTPTEAFPNDVLRFPIALELYGKRHLLLTLNRYGATPKIEGWSVYQSSDEGVTWTQLREEKVAGIRMMPAVLLENERVVMLYRDQERTRHLYSATLGDRRPPKVTSLKPEPLTNAWGGQDCLLRHNGAFFMSTVTSKAGGRGPLIARSTDEGDSWKLVSPKEWEGTYRATIVDHALLFSCGDELHALYRDVDDRIVHFASSDSGDSWKKRAGIPPPGEDRVFHLLDVVVQGPEIVLLMGESGKKEGRVFVVTSGDSGQSWSSINPLYDCRVTSGDSWASLFQVGDEVVCIGSRVYLNAEPKLVSEAICSVRRGGGKEWKRLDITQGIARTSLFAIGGPGHNGFLAVIVNISSYHQGLGGPEVPYVLVRKYGVPRKIRPALSSEEEVRRAKELVRDLDSTSVTKREKAAGALITMGRSILKVVEAELKEARGERRARLLDVRKALTPVYLGTTEK